MAYHEAPPITVLMTSGAVLEELFQGPWLASPDLKAAAANSLQHIVNMGAGITISTCRRAAAELSLNVHNLYATTESAGTTWTCRPDNDETWHGQRAPAG